MIIIKAIFILFTTAYAMIKMADAINDKYEEYQDKIVNLIEITVMILLTFIIFKI